MSVLWLDYESQSECDLPAKGASNYCQDATTKMICAAYAFDDEDVQLWWAHEPPPLRLAEYFAGDGQIRCHNSEFDMQLSWYVVCPDYKLPEPKLERWYCTAAQARANCAPGSLEDAGRFAGASMRKDHRGKQLIRQCCKPPFSKDPVVLVELGEYAMQDIRAMRAISQSLRSLSTQELEDFHVNCRINLRGVLVDVELARSAVRYASAELTEIQDSVAKVTQGAVTSVRSPRMRQWVQDRVSPEQLNLMTVEDKISIDKAVRANLLACDDLDPDVREVVQSADDLWASSVAKFARMAALADEEDHRVRGAFVFNGGAATGRACVSARTLVQTDAGEVPIALLNVGEKVLTHTGRFCTISRVIYKGREIMYRLTTKSGGWVECTEQHLLLTAEGWKNVKEFISHTQPGSAGRSDAHIYVAALPYDGGDSAVGGANARYSWHDSTGDCAAGTVKDFESGELFKVENGREEPDVWCKETNRGHLTQRLSLPVDRRRGGIRAGTSFDCDGSVGPESLAERVGNSSHRQQQNEQLLRQLGDCDASWTSSIALSEITEIVCLGEKGVWDISVEGDASYIAQGLIHHNSSYGLQVHNFTRKCAKEPQQVRDSMVADAAIVPAYGKRVTDVLKGMLRPALIPAAGKQFVVADWSGIEARCNPWLSGNGEDVLNVFRSGQDIYVREASLIFKTDEVTPDMRQIGKVAILSCGYGGSVGAFAAMGRAYGVHLPEAAARRTVDAWRRANQWAVRYWQALESAYMRAMRNPNQEFAAGRVFYLFDGVHLWYALPSGRVLCYPYARFEPDGVSYAKCAWKPAQGATEWPRARLWSGLAAENICQAVANDLLRHSLRQVDDVVLTVHDEIVIETASPDVDALRRVMCTPPDWAPNLPLNVDIKVMARYGK